MQQRQQTQRRNDYEEYNTMLTCAAMRTSCVSPALKSNAEESASAVHVADSSPGHPTATTATINPTREDRRDRYSPSQFPASCESMYGTVFALMVAAACSMYLASAPKARMTDVPLSTSEKLEKMGERAMDSRRCSSVDVRLRASERAEVEVGV